MRKRTKPSPQSSRGVLIYPKIRDAILQELERKQYAPGTRLPTDVEYAKKLRVDRLTVSRALNELASSGRVVRRRGAGTFVANALQPPLIMSRHLRVGVMFPMEVLAETVSCTFYGAVLRGLLDHWGLQYSATNYFQGGSLDPTRASWTLRERGVTVEALGRSLDSGQSHPLLKAVRDGKYDALMTVGIITEKWLEALVAMETPVVLVDYPGNNFSERADSVYVDPLDGYRKAVAWLADQGMRRIHFLGYKISVSPPTDDLTLDEVRQFRSTHRRHDPDSLLRAHAFRVAMEECGLSVPEDRMHVIPDRESSFRDFGEQLANLPAEERPDAIVGATLQHVRMVTQVFRERNLPLLGVGAHYEEGAANGIPVHVDCAAMGEAAGTLLVSRLVRPERARLRVGINMKFQPNGAGISSRVS